MQISRLVDKDKYDVKVIRDYSKEEDNFDLFDRNVDKGP